MPPRPRLTFLGAAGEVTGSCTLVEMAGLRLLVDCGLIQGSPDDEARNHDPLGIDGRDVDAVVITHLHADHVGRLPLLARTGFRGPVYGTLPTAELLPRILRSSAKLQRIQIAERAQAGTSPDDRDDVPLYDDADAARAVETLVPLPYGQGLSLGPNLTLRLLDAGHIIGSASVELTARAGAGPITLLLSGDLGARGAPLLPPPRSPPRADIVVMESTYGGRTHQDPETALAALGAVIDDARARDHLVLIPTFSLGRAQQLLHAFAALSRQGRLRAMPVYLDSHLAALGAEAYRRHPDLLDPPSAAAVRAGGSPLHFPELYVIEGRKDSRRLAARRSCGVILAGAGFCHGGPILHHLAANLARPDTDVILIGHQPGDSLGHRLAGGARRVPVLGSEIDVVARIHTLRGFSGHADHDGLLAWLGGIGAAEQGEAPTPPGAVLLQHGDEPAREALSEAIASRLAVRALRPGRAQTVEP